MNCGATYGAISSNNVIYGALSKRIYTILLVRLRAPLLFQCIPQPIEYNTFRATL